LVLLLRLLLLLLRTALVARASFDSSKVHTLGQYWKLPLQGEHTKSQFLLVEGSRQVMR
jgi:hypothetical protein